MGLCCLHAQITTIRVLILGVAASGKSTFLKQLRYLDRGTITDVLADYRDLIWSNVIVGMKELLNICRSREIEISAENRKVARFLGDLNEHELPAEELSGIVEKLKNVWKEEAVQDVWKNKHSFPLQIKHMDYLMSNIDRFLEPSFTPTHEDILMLRQRTTGVVRVQFLSDKIAWEFIDVGGQKPERQKWSDIITNTNGGIDLILFMVALDEFGTNTEFSKSQFDEVKKVFVEVMNSQETAGIPKFLFFNKLDLFKEHITSEDGFVEFRSQFPSYSGADVVDEACKFISRDFRKSVNCKISRVHIGSCLNIDLVSEINKSLQQFILNNALKQSGLKKN